MQIYQLLMRQLPKAAMVAALVASFGPAAHAQVVLAPDDTRYITRDMVLSSSGDTVGAVRIIDNPTGDDEVFLDVTLQPMTRYAMFLGQSSTVGALPVHLVGEFTTDINGRGFLSSELEVVDAFDSANPSLESGGVADIRGAGAFRNGALQIPMDFLRIYLADGSISVFSGGPQGAMGGGLIATTMMPVFNPRGSFTLFDAGTDTPIRRIQDGTTLSLSSLPPQLTVVYTTEDPMTESVQLSIGNGMILQTESLLPYALAGDDAQGTVNGRDLRPVDSFPGPGTYALTVTRFPSDGANGPPLASHTVRFVVLP